MDRNIVDLFCGCGGMSLGFQKAGFTIKKGYDNWFPAIKTYEANFKHPIEKKDLSKEDVIKEIKDINPFMIIGGPPCQDFSIAGYRKQGERANLSIKFAEIVSSVQPNWFVMENVYNIERMPVLPKIETILKNANYGITKIILDASRCGVPQKRNRFFMIGHIGDKDDFLKTILEKNLSNKQMTVRDYLGNTLGTNYYYMHPRSYARRAVFSIDEPSATIRGVNRPIPITYKKHPADKAEITQGVRCLTSKERSYIQTFPESFNFIGTKSEIEQIIGNAVPVNLAKYVGCCIKEYIGEE